MALIKCIECGQEFSSYAKACPHCACPTEIILQAMGGAQPAPVPPQAAPLAPAPVAPVEAPVAPDPIPTPPSEAIPVVIPVPVEPAVPVQAQTAPFTAEKGRYYGVKKTLDEKTFYRDALLALTKDEGTPPDIFEAEFESAALSNKHLAMFTGNVTGSYSAEVGFDMVREWTEYQNGRAVKRRENYIKWEPFSGNYAGSKLAYKDLDEDPMDEEIEIAYGVALVDHDLESQQEATDDIVEPTEADINDAMEICKDMASRECERGLPGNHSRNFSFSGFATMDHYVCHTIPTYSLPFTYQGESYKKSFFAMQEHEGASFGRIPEISDEIHEKADKKLRPLGIVALVFLSLSIAVSFAFAALHEYLYRVIGLSVSLAVFATGIATTISYWVLHKKHIRSIIKANLLAKLQGLEKVLVGHGIEPLSEEEKDEILGRCGK